MFDVAVTHVGELWLSSFSLPQALRRNPDGAPFSADALATFLRLDFFFH